jgi:hypothetical protein
MMAKTQPAKSAKTSAAKVDAFLRRLAATPNAAPAGEKGRLLFAMDATASRESTWDRACQIQGEMFSETAALGGLQVQMVYFRGFGEFRASRWLNNSAALVRQMTGVHCMGGHTQIGRVLGHALNETRKKPISALVFVGDCMEENADDLCAQAGELGVRKVPVFVFQEGEDGQARSTFQQMAKLSGGAYCRFDSSSARQLRDLLSAVAVYAAGGRAALADFSRQAGGDVLMIANQLK